MKIKNILFFFIFIVITFVKSYAQPLKLNWKEDLVGKWQVYKMDTAAVPAHAKLFLEFLPNKVLMHNQGRIREGEWRVMDVERKILIRTEEGVESWNLLFLDGTQLSIFDTVGNTAVHFKRFQGEIGSTLPTKAVRTTQSDLIGTWLVVSVNGQNSPVNLKISFSTDGQMQLKVGQELQKAVWKLDESKTRIILVPEGAAPIDWIVTEISTDNLSFVDQKDEMRLTRYVYPVTPDTETGLLGKWRIIEVGGVAPPNENIVRSVTFHATGSMEFHSNDKKEGEGSWGLSDTRTGIHIVSKSSNEYWKILSYSEKELLLEIDGLKMLLKR